MYFEEVPEVYVPHARQSLPRPSSLALAEGRVGTRSTGAPVAHPWAGTDFWHSNMAKAFPRFGGCVEIVLLIGLSIHIHLGNWAAQSRVSKVFVGFAPLRTSDSPFRLIKSKCRQVENSNGQT